MNNQFDQPTHEDKPLAHDPGHVRTREHYERMARDAEQQKQQQK